MDVESTEVATDAADRTDPVRVVERAVEAYNAKNFGRYALFFTEDVRYCHHNRGFEFPDRATFLAATRVFAGDLVPDRRLGPATRLVRDGDVVVREQVWTATAVADFPGVAAAGESVALEFCTVYVFRGDRIAEYHEYG